MSERTESGQLEDLCALVLLAMGAFVCLAVVGTYAQWVLPFGSTCSRSAGPIQLSRLQSRLLIFQARHGELPRHTAHLLGPAEEWSCLVWAQATPRSGAMLWASSSGLPPGAHLDDAPQSSDALVEWVGVEPDGALTSLDRRALQAAYNQVYKNCPP